MLYDLQPSTSTTRTQRLILFLCTGNFYRSRFAEIVFNHAAAQAGLDWRADSRGLDIAQLPTNHGPISRHTLQALADRQIPIPQPPRFPIALEETDLKKADRVIALKDAEHRPMVERNFPQWLNRIEFWHVHDLDQAPPDKALPEIEKAVLDLVTQLKAEK